MRASTLRRLAIKGLIFVKKYLPVGLAIVSAGCAVGTVVTAIQAAENVPEEEHKEEQTTIEKVKYYGKRYWKPVVFCAGSVAAGGLSAFIFSKRQKDLTISMEQTSRLLDKYVKAATATAGVEGAKVVAKIQESQEMPEEFEKPPEDDGLTLFWDPYFHHGYDGHWFRASETDFVLAAYEMAKKFSLLDRCTCEDFFETMGVDPPMYENGTIAYGWGWYKDEHWDNEWGEAGNCIDIQYSNKMIIEDGPDTGVEYRIVRYIQDPHYYDDLLWVH